MIKLAVIGVGYLGRFHAEKLSSIEGARLEAVVDRDPSRAEETGKALGVPYYTDHRDVADHVDGACVVVSTPAHFQVAKDLIEKGIHVLIEKPITNSVDHAKELVRLSKEHGVVLQVGHSERFNFRTLTSGTGIELTPRFIECHRLAPFKPRSLEVDVIDDLMIHDIDLVLQLAGEDPVEIHANGAPVATGTTDIANARLVFKNGLVANLTASRISTKVMRKFRVFQKMAYVSVDFYKKQTDVFYPGTEPGRLFEHKHLEFSDNDVLRSEIESFISCIQERKNPVVSGVDGLRALEVASVIQQKISNSP